MYNLISKTILPLFVLVAGLLLASCDGKHRKYKSNTDVLTEHQLLDAFSEQIGFIPEGPTQITTDTILNTGFRIKIQYRALEDNFISKTETAPNKTNKTLFYKNFEAHVNISKHNKALLNQVINKAHFTNPIEADFWKVAIMQFIWVDYEATTKHSVCLNTSFRIPNTNNFKDYSILVYDNGTFTIKETTPYINSI